MKTAKPMILSALAIAFFVYSAGTFQAKPGHSSTSYLSMTIDDTVSGAATSGITSDGVNSGVYKDHNLVNGDKCVTATVSNGFVFVQQNYVISTHPKQGWCNAQSGASTPRYWRVNIDDNTACASVFGINPTVPCTFTGSDMTNTDYEAVHPNDVFGASSVPVVFQFTTDGRTTGRSVRTDSNATVNIGQLNNTRVVTYMGTAKLYESAGPLSPSFPFAFQLTFEEAH